MVLEKTPESPLESKEIKPVNLKENQPWIFAGRTDAKAETPVFWWSDANSWFIGKVPDAGKDWGQKKKRASDDEMPNHLSVMFVCNHVRRETAAKRSREALEENESLLTPRTLIVAFSSPNLLLGSEQEVKLYTGNWELVARASLHGCWYSFC